MSIKSMAVQGLFGRLDYNLIFEPNDVTIITGPNGYGKTMLLRIVDGVLNNNFKTLLKIKFDSIYISCVGGLSINIERIKKDLMITLSDLKMDRVAVEHIKEDDFLESEKEIYYFNDDGEQVLLNFNATEKKINSLGIDKDVYFSYLGGMSSTFIKAQRLQDVDAKMIKVKQLAEDLKNRMSLASFNAAIVSQKLDSSFPARLFDKIEGGSGIGRSIQVSERLRGLQKIKDDYLEYDLIESDDDFSSARLPSSEISTAYSEVLNLYIEDALKKLDSYNDLYKRIDLFVSIIKGGVLSFKEMKVDRLKGFYFVDSGRNDEIIPLDSLSSGEQNQIIIYYDMIFKSKDNTIILIDEPEISLHVAWQKCFLDSVSQIKKLNHPANIIIATHSPAIINNKWELSHDLFELSGVSN